MFRFKDNSPRLTARAHALIAGAVLLLISTFSAQSAFAADPALPQTAGAARPADAVSGFPFVTISATPTGGVSPMTVDFATSASTSTGLIMAYWVDFGDGTRIDYLVNGGLGAPSFSANPSHVYTTSGIFSARVFATDETSTTVGAQISIIVRSAVGQAPLITATPASGTVPLTVSFTSSADSGPTGPLISAYQVNYGDGYVNSFFLNAGDGAVKFSKVSNHVYTATGAYTATLTVAYVDGSQASKATVVNVLPVVVPPALRSSAIDLSAVLKSNKVNATGRVIVRNGSGALVSGATVKATWSKPGGGTATQTATTNSNGVAVFSTSGSRGTYTLTVGGISKTSYVFDAANSVLSASITR